MNFEENTESNAIYFLSILKKYVESAVDGRNTKDVGVGDERVLEKLLKIDPGYMFALTTDILIAGMDTVGCEFDFEFLVFATSLLLCRPHQL